MLVYIHQQDLKKAIEKTEKVLKKTSIAILNSVLLTAKNDKITLTAYNLESGIVIDLDGSIIENGSVLIDKSNFKLIKKLQGELKIESKDSNTVTISSNRQIKFRQYEVGDYPEMSIETNNEAFTIPESEFKNSLKIKSFARVDNVIPVLESLCINHNRIVGLDNYKLAIINLNIDNQCDKDIIIPLESIEELDKILDKKSNGILKFSYDYNEKEKEFNRLTITGDDYVYVTRLIQGEYIKVDQLIPKDFKIRVGMDKVALTGAMEFAKEIAKDIELGTVVFDVADEFAVTAQSNEKQSREVVPSDINGGEVKIGFNHKYILEALKVIEDKDIVINLNECPNPTVITGAETENEMYMVLPVRLVS